MFKTGLFSYFVPPLIANSPSARVNESRFRQMPSASVCIYIALHDRSRIFFEEYYYHGYRSYNTCNNNFQPKSAQLPIFISSPSIPICAPALAASPVSIPDRSPVIRTSTPLPPEIPCAANLTGPPRTPPTLVVPAAPIPGLTAAPGLTPDPGFMIMSRSINASTTGKSCPNTAFHSSQSKFTLVPVVVPGVWVCAIPDSGPEPALASIVSASVPAADGDAEGGRVMIG